MSKLKLLIILLLLFLFTGCAQQQYMTTFTPPEQQVPQTLDMSYSGPRANIAVGDFTVKARNSTNYIGDGLRAMLQSVLFESNRFYVLDRLDPQGLSAEQQLSYSKMARRDAPKLGAQMDVAELLFYGTVTEFEAEASGGRVKASLPNARAPVSANAGMKNAHMAIDIRVGRCCFRTPCGRQTNRRIGFVLQGSYRHNSVQRHGHYASEPGAFKNTPMELAIRDCIYRSVIYAANSLPQQYFSH